MDGNGSALWQDERLTAGLLAGVLLWLYAWSMPRTVVLDDDGFFLQAAYLNAVGHPPGYPLYVALAHMATYLPWGSVASRVHLLSAVFAALGCATLALLVHRLTRHAGAALIAAVCLGLSTTFWSQAIIADVYSLNVLLCFLLFICALDLGRENGVPTAWATGGWFLLYGLALSNHWPLVVLWSPALLVLLWPVRVRILGQWRPASAGLLLGLLPYAWLVYRTQAVPEYCFAGPIRDISDFWYFVSREPYRNVDHSVTADWGDKLRYAGFVLAEIVRQFGWVGAAVGAAGCWHQWRLVPARVAVALVCAFLGPTFILVALLGFDFDEMHRNYFSVYPLTAWGVFATWIAFGVQWLVGVLHRQRRLRVSGGVAAGFAGLLLVGVMLPGSVADNFRARDDWVERYARLILDRLPAGATLYANAGTVNGPVGYLHWVEHVRPDIILQNGHSFTFRGELVRPFQLPYRDLLELFDDYLGQAETPVFYTNDFPHRYGVVDYGLFFEVQPDRRDRRSSAARVTPIVEFLERTAAGPVPRDRSIRLLYWLLREDHCRLWLNFRLAAGAALPDRLTPACATFNGSLLWLQAMLDGAAPDSTRVHTALAAAEARADAAIRKTDLRRLDELRQRAGRLPSDRPVNGAGPGP